jgi:hypothetical protein
VDRSDARSRAVAPSTTTLARGKRVALRAGMKATRTVG